MRTNRSQWYYAALLAIVALWASACSHRQPARAASVAAASRTAPAVAAAPPDGSAVDRRAIARELGRRYTAWFLAGKLKPLHEKFSTAVKDALSLERLAAVREQITRQLGLEAKLVSEQISLLPGYEVYRRTVDSKDGLQAVYAWSLNGETVVGFFVRPASTDKPAKTPYANYRVKQRYRLPFGEPFTVFWGGRTLAQNYHARAVDQRFAYDLLIAKNGKTYRGAGKDNHDYYCFDRPILAAGAGRVLVAIDGRPDQVPGIFDTEQPLGNHVIIDHGNGEYGFYCHFKRGSLAVTAGQHVEAGANLGRCGNSGRSSEPHLHFHLQDSARPFAGRGLPVRFFNYRAGGQLIAEGEPVQGQEISPVQLTR